MTRRDREQQASFILEDLADEIDISPSKYEQAENSYEAVGDWLGRDGSRLASLSPTVAAHGSVALGTANQPYLRNEVDIDAACLLAIGHQRITPKRLKDMVGDRLKEHAKYAQMLESRDGRRRCWTLQYADGSKFHLDVVPAVAGDPEPLIALGVPQEFAQHVIYITDKTDFDRFFSSNPQGFIEWFRLQMRPSVQEVLEKTGEVKPLHTYAARTSLQRAIQLLKRHRDVFFGEDEDCPVSIIITTLAAKGYRDTPNLAETLRNMIPAMRCGIEARQGQFWVPNPVDPRENFADKWNERVRKRHLCMQWLDVLERETDIILEGEGFEHIGERLIKGYGESVAKGALLKYQARRGERSSRTLFEGASLAQRAETRLDVPHRERLRWPYIPSSDVAISATCRHQGITVGLYRAGALLPKGVDLEFLAQTTAAAPFTVFWQVVNTGEQARVKQQLRGKFFNTDVRGDGLHHRENTEYTGTHWIECFIVKGGVCVARSGEFVVRVA